MAEEPLGQMIRLRYAGEGQFEPTGIAVSTLLDKTLVIGECYRFDIYHDRSESFHRKYFAAIADSWEHLREPWNVMLPSPEHLRKYALCKAGWCDVATIVSKSKEEVVNTINSVKLLDTYCLAIPSGNVLTIYKARSQARSYQDARDFYETAVKVFHVIGEMIGVDPLSLYNPKEMKP